MRTPHTTGRTADDVGMLALLRRVRSDRGVTAVEYGLMVALAAVAVTGVMFLLSDNLSSLFAAAQRG